MNIGDIVEVGDRQPEIPALPLHEEPLTPFNLPGFDVPWEEPTRRERVNSPKEKEKVDV